VDDFLAQGWQVLGVDRVPVPSGGDIPRSDADFRVCDLQQVEPLLQIVAGCDAIVHLAAIPTPTLGTREEVFKNNVNSAFAVLEASSRAGVGKVVLASSTSAYGMAFAEPAFPPLYVPIDENHPLLAADAYALSKQVNEMMAAMYCRATSLSAVGLRFHWIARPGEGSCRATEADSDSEFQIRRQWGYVDVRDAAEACRLSVLARISGFEAFNIVGPFALSEQPIEILLDRHLPDVERRSPLARADSVFSIEKARRMLGWSPRYHWRGA
jgi:nucleoside-diphosphate-sugar epimerase